MSSNENIHSSLRFLSKSLFFFSSSSRDAVPTLGVFPAASAFFLAAAIEHIKSIFYSTIKLV